MITVAYWTHPVAHESGPQSCTHFLRFVLVHSDQTSHATHYTINKLLKTGPRNLKDVFTWYCTGCNLHEFFIASAS